MAYRVTTYKQAFEGELGLVFGGKLKAFVAKLEREGHTEKSICFTIWKKQEKLSIYKHDPRFFSILANEVNKWSWKKDDPRWKDYWQKKNEEKKAEAIRQELYKLGDDAYELSQIDKQAKKSPKNKGGYVYFIQGQCGGAIKVGYSVNPRIRLKELQTGYPDTLLILAIIPGTQHTEATLHRQFDASRLKGEWFRPDDYVVKAIKELKEKYTTSKEGEPQCKS